jgi:hypothetical protein
MKSDRAPGFQERAPTRQCVQCPICYSDGEFYASGIVEDFTTAGVRVRGTHPVRLDMKLVVFLILPGRNATLFIRRASVRWTSANTFGIALTEVSVGSYDELSRLAAIHLPGLWSSLN